MKKKHKRRARLVEYFNEQGGRCAYCLTDMILDLGYDNTATIEHITPRADGGTKRGHNEVCACFSCNNSKGRTPLVIWLASKRNPEKQMQLELN